MRILDAPTLLAACLLSRTYTTAFAPSMTTTRTRLSSLSSNNNNVFDISKPVFDLFTLRSIRGDALLRYNTLNQSEPLRINLFALAALSLFAFPSISETVGNGQINMIQSAACIAGGAGNVGLFVRECQSRSNQLYRIEKELNSASLQLRLPMNALSDKAFTDPATLKTLTAASSPPRIVAICGTASQLSEELQSIRIYGRRLKQASTFVLPVPTDQSTRADWNLGTATGTRLNWLAEAYETESWISYFDNLQESNNNELRWFGLSSNGRSFGSGAGESPNVLQMLGQFLRPTTILDEDDANVVATDETTKMVFEAQDMFYKALVSGDLEGMNAICGDVLSDKVTEVVDSGGRVDGWASCLEPDARPTGMQIAGSDAVVISDTEAYTTIIEFPANASTIDGMTASLLAVQQWSRSSKNDEWKLALHQTIPWTEETRAQGTLRCDCRGCVALTRERERRTFGGIIG